MQPNVSHFRYNGAFRMLLQSRGIGVRGMPVGGGRRRIERRRKALKLVDEAARIACSGVEAVRAGQEVVRVAEHAVFRSMDAACFTAE